MMTQVIKANKAVAQIRSSDDKYILGYIQFSQDINGDGYTIITGDLRGLTPGEHGMHIHEKGDPRKCCSALGDHYNPYNQTHGGLDTHQRHVGDMGNIMVDSYGNCQFKIKDKMIKVAGPISVIGRSLVIHENKDDLGMTNNKESKLNGNSGKRIAYGIIGYA
jgi:Cu-Zn family superoxide dismutase